MLALRSGSVDVADLARRFDVTTETIRRDLSDLQQRQLLRRVHGGAVPVRAPPPRADGGRPRHAERRGEAAHRARSHPRGARARLGDRRLRLDRSALRRGVPGRPPRARRHELAAHGRDAGPPRRQRVDGARRRRADEHVRDGRCVHGRGGAGAARRRAVHQLRRAVVPTRPDDAVPRRERRRSER